MKTRDPKDRKRTDRGFSLTELLVVMGIIAVMSAVSVPAIARYIRNYRIRSASQNLAGRVQEARLKAITKNVNLGVVVVTLTNNSYRWVIEDIPPAAAQANISQRPTIDAAFLTANPRQASPVFELPQGVVFEPTPPGGPGANDVGFRFNKLGTWCDPDAAATRCPAGNIRVGAPFVANGADGAQFTLFDQRNQLRRRVTVTPGGRVLEEGL